MGRQYRRKVTAMVAELEGQLRAYGEVEAAGPRQTVNQAPKSGVSTVLPSARTQNLRRRAARHPEDDENMDEDDNYFNDSLDIEAMEAHVTEQPRPRPQQPPKSVAIAKRPITAQAPVQIVPAKQPEYAWSRDVRKILVQQFRLAKFRVNQLEAINATLSGKDVFVLMPTGEFGLYVTGLGLRELI